MSNFLLANQFTPGGVHSPVRACNAVNSNPIFWHGAYNSYLVDVNNIDHLDYICGFGPIILGHNQPQVVAAITKQAANGLVYGGCAYQAPEFSELICGAFASMEKVRLMNTGTEACMTAIRLARAHTNKAKVIKCKGAYHGHYDEFLVAAGSGALTTGKPSSQGVTDAAVSNTILLDFNDLEAVEACFTKYDKQIAAVIVEPICGNMGMVLPKSGYLSGLRKLCDKYNACLIFDEVMTGFRVAYGGAQVYYGIDPDITVLGKIIGGGLPIGAVGGRAEIMDLLSPVGSVYQAGTFSANPMSVAAGLATLRILTENQNIYMNLQAYNDKLTQGMQQLAIKYNIPLQTCGLGGMLGVFFTNNKVNSLTEAITSDQQMFISFYKTMLKYNIVIPPSVYEAMFITIEHNDKDLEHTLNAVAASFAVLHDVAAIC